jgi:hypothetical protein
LTTVDGRWLVRAASSNSGRAAPDHLERPDGIDAVDALEIFRRQLVQQAVLDVLGGAGVVDQGVETAPGGGRGGDPPAIVVARNITLNHDDIRARGSALIGRPLGLGLAGSIIDDQPRARLRQADGRCRAQPRCRPRHNHTQTIHRRSLVRCRFSHIGLRQRCHYSPIGATR